MKHIAVIFLSAAVFTVACKKKSDAEDTKSPSAASSNEGQDNRPEQATVSVDDRIATMCNIPETHFDFDSDNLSPSAKSTLQALANCFIDGPAKDESMRLVGHADPRGTENYNLALGQRRAGTVAGYLTNSGLADARIETSSRGELDAVGTDESSWAQDRRVEILLAR